MATTKLNNGQLPTTLSSKTIDNTNDINTTTTKLKISGGSNGQVLSTDGSGNLSWTTAGGGGGGLGDPTAIVTKTADETVTNSTTLQNDDDFSYSLVSGRYYVFEWILFVSRTNTTDNCGWKIAVNANSDGYFGALSITGLGTLTNGTATQSAVNFATNAGVPSRVSLQAHIKCTSNNTLQVSFAQQTLSANTGITLMKNSRMLVWDLGT